MEKEISNGAALGILLITLAATLGIGFGVFEIAKGTAGEMSIVHIINAAVLSATAMAAWVSFLIAARLSYLNHSYYSNRFKFIDSNNVVLNAKYIENVKLSTIQMLILLFKPVRYKFVETFDIDNYIDLDLEGQIQVIDKKLFIDKHYLDLNTDLLEHLDSVIKLKIRVAGFKQIIEKNITSYEVLQVIAV